MISEPFPKRRRPERQKAAFRRTTLFRFPGLAAGLLMALDLLVLQLTIFIGPIHECVHTLLGKAAVVATECAGRVSAARMTAGRMRTPRMAAGRVRAARVTAGHMGTRLVGVRQCSPFPLRVRTLRMTADQVRVDSIQIVHTQATIAPKVCAGEERALHNRTVQV